MRARRPVLRGVQTLVRDAGAKAASAGTAMLACCTLVGAIASAQENGQRTAKVVPERPARVFIMAAYDEQCRSLPAPAIAVEQAPGKGSISFRPGQGTTIQASSSGACAGAKVEGTGIYYTAAKGQSGTDTFTIRASLPDGKSTSRTFTVEIATD